MITTRMRIRRAAFRLADLLEDIADELRRRAEWKRRPRPLRFPTEGEELIRALVEASIRKAGEDLVFLDGGLLTKWDDKIIGGIVRVRVPNEYL